MILAGACTPVHTLSWCWNILKIHFSSNFRIKPPAFKFIPDVVNWSLSQISQDKKIEISSDKEMPITGSVSPEVRYLGGNKSAKHFSWNALPQLFLCETCLKSSDTNFKDRDCERCKDLAKLESLLSLTREAPLTRMIEEVLTAANYQPPKQVRTAKLE